MKTVNANYCPSCGKPTTDNDYYWHTHTDIPRKNNPNCKECVCEKEKKRSQAKRDEKKMYF